MKNSNLSYTRQQLLDNTKKRYNSYNRAVNNNEECLYITENNNRCAIGIELTPNTCHKLNQVKPTLEGGTSVRNKEIFNTLPKRLQDMGEDFLSDIQSLHDCGWYWNSEGLTQDGLSKVNQIKAIYNLN